MGKEIYRNKYKIYEDIKHNNYRKNISRLFKKFIK